MKAETSIVLVSLPSLTRKDLKLVQQELTKLLEAGTDRTQDREEEELEFFYNVSRTVMKERGLTCPPWRVFRRMGIFKPLKKKFPEVKTYTEKYFGNIQRRKRQAIYRVYAELLMEWMDNHPKVPMKVGTFFQSLNQIPTLIADAFPGYAEQGWLPMVLKIGRRDHRNPPMEE